jgi:hypothetical protein
MPRRYAIFLLAVFFGAVFSAGFAAALSWWNEAHLPMTSARYAILRGGQPECYPEVGYFLGAISAGGIAASAGILAMIFAGMLLLRR